MTQPKQELKPINVLLLKYLPYIVLLGVLLCSFIAFELGGNIMCMRSGGKALIDQKCTVIQVQDMGVCKEDYISDKWFLVTQTNYSINVTP